MFCKLFLIVVAISTTFAEEVVKLDLYYETLDRYCIFKYPELPLAVKALGSSVQLQTLPFGKAKFNENNGNITVHCEHGDEECYGNKLHACAIDLLKDPQSYTDYNSCMMQRNSDDTAADVCGEQFKVDSNAIKECAKGEKSQQLLIEYGRRTIKYFKRHIKYMPYIRINGKEFYSEYSILQAACMNFKKPPPVCMDMFVKM